MNHTDATTTATTDIKLTDTPASPNDTTAALADDIRIPFHKFRLDNGLTVIVHENHRAPVVTINIWYRVGAKEEPPGQTGFAHLFEHLMFGGSKNFPGRYISNMTDAGATSLNGTTNRDRTNYFETVPTAALDYALFAESDRMGHFFETISQETLDLQRGVVQNEKRQREGAPYGLVYERIVQGTYPAGHPYAHTTLGSMEDLDAANLDKVRSWFRKYYSPSNAVLTLAGDIDLETARHKVTQYFGDIPPGQPLSRPRKWIAKMTGTKREILEDRVFHAALHMVWNVPEYGHRDITGLGLAASVLSSGMSSRLRKRLVYDQQLATSVSASVSAGTIAGQFTITATIADGVEVAFVERAIREELAHLLAKGVTTTELERARSRDLAAFVRELDSTSGIADMLSMNEVRLGSPDAFLELVTRFRQATPESVKEAAVRWLSDGVYILHVVPFPTLRARAQGVDRSRIPAIGKPSGITLPELQRDVLTNGLRIILAERHELPLVRCSMLLQTGSASEQPGTFGLTRFMSTMLSLGAGTRTALEFSEAKHNLGAEIATTCGFEWNTVTLSAIKARLAESLDLYADLILRPRFAPEDVAREKSRALQQIAQSVSTPGRALKRVLQGLLLPKGHPYARPLTSAGLTSTLESFFADDLRNLHATMFSPHTATLVIAGDITMGEIKPLLERRFAEWRTPAPKSLVVPEARRPHGPAVYFIDKPDTPQAIVVAATLTDPIHPTNALAARILHRVLGADFGSRLNMNLREDKNWTYGVRTHWEKFRGGPNTYYAQAPVQIDRTAESMREILRELTDITGPQPVTADELARAQQYDTLRLAGTAATLSGLASSIEQLVFNELPGDYWSSYADRVRAVTLESVHEAAGRLIGDPRRMVWIIAGDITRFEGNVRALNFGPVTTVQAEGRALYMPDM